MEGVGDRPRLGPGLDEPEFLRWYWLKDELVGFAAVLGVSSAGSKQVLTGRIAAHLGGRPFAEPEAAPRAVGGQLEGELTQETVIPAGQRSSQVLRAWFSEQIGPGFRFDAAMRGFIADSDGTRTLGDAVAHWHATRGTAALPIAAQFEYNRFTRDWYLANPAGTRQQCVAAWRQYRGLPVDERERP